MQTVRCDYNTSVLRVVLHEHAYSTDVSTTYDANTSHTYGTVAETDRHIISLLSWLHGNHQQLTIQVHHFMNNSSNQQPIFLDWYLQRSRGDGEGRHASPRHTRSNVCLKKIGEFVAKTMRCGRQNDVDTGAYNMPEPRSARTSAAPSSSRRWGEGPNTTMTFPRHDLSLPLQGHTSQVNVAGLDSMPEQTHFVDQNADTGYDAYTQGDGSQPYPSTRGIRMPEETRFPDINQHIRGEGSQSYNTAQVCSTIISNYKHTTFTWLLFTYGFSM